MIKHNFILIFFLNIRFINVNFTPLWKVNLIFNIKSVLDGELAVPCNLKPALRRIEIRWKGFAENERPQSDSPTANRESLRLFLSISASLGFENLCSIDVSAAFLQAEKLERDVYVKLPKFMNPDDSWAYKLEKPLYGLSDAGRKFWLKLKKILKERYKV